jgi:hypothetical protein
MSRSSLRLFPGKHLQKVTCVETRPAKAEPAIPESLSFRIRFPDGYGVEPQSLVETLQGALQFGAQLIPYLPNPSRFGTNFFNTHGNPPA